MIALAPPARRGRIMGVYTSIISAGFAAGPLCLLVVGSHGWPPFLVGISAFVICGACLASRPQAIAQGRRCRAPGFRAGFRAAGVAAAVRGGRRRRVRAGHAGAAAGLRHALRHRPKPACRRCFPLMIAGNITLQIPLGLLAERLTAQTVRLACVVGYRARLRAAAGSHRDAADLADGVFVGRRLLRHLHDGADRARRAVLRTPC